MLRVWSAARARGTPQPDRVSMIFSEEGVLAVRVSASGVRNVKRVAKGATGASRAVNTAAGAAAVAVGEVEAAELEARDDASCGHGYGERRGSIWGRAATIATGTVAIVTPTTDARY